MQRKHFSGLASTLFLIGGLLIIWIAFAPAKLGGKVSYVIVSGNSMEPVFHSGDLVVVRKTDSYQVGDVVSYRDAQMEAYVFHRIIGTEQDRFIVKGDNNSWVDQSQPTEAEIIGKLWIHLPGMGKIVKWVQSPLHVAIVTGFLGGLFMVDIIVQNKKKNKKNKPAQSPAEFFEIIIYTLGLLVILFLGLTIYSFSQPLQKLGKSIPYTQSGIFTYSAAGSPTVYDTGSAQSGEPVFTKLTCTLNVGFTYAMQSDDLEGISGYQQFYARVAEDQSGWQRIIPLTEAVNFSSNTFSNSTALDLCQVESLVTEMQGDTGIRANSSYTLSIVSRVSVSGKISEADFNNLFEPQITFRFDSLHFYLVANTDKTDPLTTVKSEAIPNLQMVDNSIKLLGVTSSVRKIRAISLIGMEVFLFLLAGLGLYLYFISRQSTAAKIRLKYGNLLIDVSDTELETNVPVTEVARMEDLVKLAERSSVMIMHVPAKEENMPDYYLVKNEGIVYRYTADHLE